MGFGGVTVDAWVEIGPGEFPYFVAGIGSRFGDGAR
jgi:hypothetical protein